MLSPSACMNRWCWMGATRWRTYCWMIDGVADVSLVEQEEKWLRLWMLQSSVETANNGGKSQRADLWAQRFCPLRTRVSNMWPRSPSRPIEGSSLGLFNGCKSEVSNYCRVSIEVRWYSCVCLSYSVVIYIMSWQANCSSFGFRQRHKPFLFASG